MGLYRTGVSIGVGVQKTKCETTQHRKINRLLAIFAKTGRQIKPTAPKEMPRPVYTEKEVKEETRMGIPDLPAQLKIMQWHKLWRVCLLVVLFEELGGCALLPIGGIGALQRKQPRCS